MLDVYPDKLNGVVKRIKDSIDPSTYEYLTNEKCVEVPDNPAIETIVGGCTKITRFKNCQGFVVKTSIVGLNFDIFMKKTDLIFGENYTATNSEGGVTKDFFGRAKRVIVANQLRKIIKENHLDKIKVPEKYLCSFPDKLVSSCASIPFDHRHVFVLCETCDVDYVGERTLEEVRKMSIGARKKLAHQINILFSNSPLLDFHSTNYYIKDGGIVFFDTEPMSLVLPHLLCVSPTLRIARVNFKNLERNFRKLPEGKPFVDLAKRSIIQIRTKEKERRPRALCVTLVFIASMILFSYLMSRQSNAKFDLGETGNALNRF